ncbi:MAG: endopeptidase La, partial [Patescibacteria group bacterium]|nr:endopeptidase La [Patescibacteria group bacterium]
MSDQINVYPAVTLTKAIVFPTEKISLVLEGEDVPRAVDQAHKSNHLVTILFKKNGSKSEIGVVALIDEHWSLGPTITGLLVEGLRRVKVINEFQKNGVTIAEVEEFPSEVIAEEENMELEALSRTALDRLKKILQMEGQIPLMLMEDLQKERLSPEKASDLISWVLKMDFPEKLTLLETLDVHKRLEILVAKLSGELNIAQAEQRIQNEVEKDVEETQKEFLLRERLKAIEKELGIFEEQKEYDVLEQKLLQAGIPKDSEGKVLDELRRLKHMPASSAEAPYIRTYLEWIADLPWSKSSSSNMDLKKAREVLDKDHYGLKKAKERVLEYLAVQKLTGGKSRGNILVFVGPPGTGKTSVGQSIAKALGRHFVRISLGGIRDEAEIRGHRRTYVGALPGRIIQGMRTAGSKNPVFMMDEVDKIGADFRGDPASALLEVLDPAQNNSFSDHYIEIPFDLSQVFFITTANILDPIPPALRDRLEIIEFPGYTDEEKFHIARRFLMPRVLSAHGLNEDKLKVEDEMIRKIINRYTREAGVRELERKLAEISRKIALAQAEGQNNGLITITESNVADYLGPEEFEPTAKEEQNEVGVATGLAWTPVGGETIFIESALTPGKGNLTITGQLGEVMQESARAALSYVRSRSRNLGFADNFYYKSDIHVHVPSGAIPKDGPSSGIAIATSLASTLTKRKVKKDLALTGEVTLSGKVLKVGGIKEKVLAVVIKK